MQDLGYLTSKACEICKQKPAWIEPRFGYVFCRDHKDVPPVEWSRHVIEAKKARGESK